LVLVLQLLISLLMRRGRFRAF